MSINTNLKSLTPRREAYKKQINLVSGGFYNPTAFPAGLITVYPWDSSIDTWFQARLRQPKREYALWEAVEKVAAMNGATYMQMPAGDIMTVLMVSRAIRSNCIIEYTSVCPFCQHKATGKLAIPDELSKLGEKKPDYLGYDEITLPDCKDVVRLRVLTVADEMIVGERSEDDKKTLSDTEALPLAALVSVGGGKPESIQESILWYRALSPKDSEFLIAQRVALSPQLDPDIHILCDGCSKEYVYVLDLRYNFFRVA